MNGLPREMQELADRLAATESRDVCLRMAYDALCRKYRGYRVLTYLLFWRAFDTNLYRIWRRSGFLHCHQMNMLMRVLLVRSGKFTEEDVESKWTFVWGSPHQYLKVRIDDETFVYVDVWGRAFGVPYDDYARGFV